MNELRIIAIRLRDIRNQREFIEKSLHMLQVQSSLLNEYAQTLEDKAKATNPDVVGRSMLVENDLPQHFKTHEHKAMAYYVAEDETWTAVIEGLYDGIEGASDPYFVDHGHPTAQAALDACHAQMATVPNEQEMK